MVRIGILEDDIRSAALLKELVIGTGLKTIEVDTFEKVNEDFTIYFRGSEEEWNDVEVADRGNDILETCKMVFDYKD